MPETYLFDCHEYENFKPPTLQALTAYQSIRTKEENSDTLKVTDNLTLEMLGLSKEWLKDRRQDGLQALISGRRGYPTEYYPAVIKHHFRNLRHDTSRAIKPLSTGTYPAYRELNGFIRVNLSTLEQSALNRRGGRFKKDWEQYEKQLANLLPELLNLERKSTTGMRA